MSMEYIDSKSLEKFFRIWDLLAWTYEQCRKGTSIYPWLTYLFRTTENVWKRYGLIDNNMLMDIIDPSDIILAHWITYIMDYQMPTDKVWFNAFPIVLHVVHQYRRYKLSSNEIEKEYFRNNKGLCLKPGTEFCFIHRFKSKIKDSIIRTLEILEHHRRDIVYFMLEITKLGEECNWVRKVAVALYFLTYDTKVKTKNILVDLDENLETFEKKYSRRYGLLDHHTDLSKGVRRIPRYKRLWSAFRDYLKGELHERFVRYAIIRYSEEFPDHVITRWLEPEKYLDQLELPGDIWNFKFYNKIKHLLYNYLDARTRRDPVYAIRYLYEKYKDEFQKHGYPEQFDITFHYKNLCNQKLCLICPIYKNRNTNIIKNLCKDSEGKTCWFFLLLGYLVKCDKEKCPICGEKVDRIPNICKGWIHDIMLNNK